MEEPKKKHLKRILWNILILAGISAAAAAAYVQKQKADRKEEKAKNRIKTYILQQSFDLNRFHYENDDTELSGSGQPSLDTIWFTKDRDGKPVAYLLDCSETELLKEGSWDPQDAPDYYKAVPADIQISKYDKTTYGIKITFSEDDVQYFSAEYHGKDDISVDLTFRGVDYTGNLGWRSERAAECLRFLKDYAASSELREWTAYLYKEEEKRESRKDRRKSGKKESWKKKRSRKKESGEKSEAGSVRELRLPAPAAAAPVRVPGIPTTLMTRISTAMPKTSMKIMWMISTISRTRRIISTIIIEGDRNRFLTLVSYHGLEFYQMIRMQGEAAPFPVSAAKGTGGCAMTHIFRFLFVLHFRDMTLRRYTKWNLRTSSAGSGTL